MVTKYKILLLCLLLISPCYNSYASAWLQKEGSGQSILTASYYNSGSFIDKEGNKTDTKPFTKWEVNPFFEYGVTDDITVGLSPSFQALAQKQDSSIKYNSNFAYSDFLLRAKLLQGDSYVFSLQPLIKIPGFYDDEQRPFMGKKQVDLELRLLAGYGFKLDIPVRIIKVPYPGQSQFVNFEFAYRKHLGDTHDELRFDSTLGFRFDRQILLMAQVFSIFSLDPLMDGGNLQNDSSGFSMVKAQASVVGQITEDKSLQLGFYNDLWGRNAGRGAGVILALWYNF